MKQQHKFISIFLIVLAVLGAALISLFTVYFVRKPLDRMVDHERMNQLFEITNELFSGTEWKIRQHWDDAAEVADRFADTAVTSADDICIFLQDEDRLCRFGEEDISSILIDEDGRLYTADGPQGILSDVDPLINCTDRISFISDDKTDAQDHVMFVYALRKPAVFSKDGMEKKMCFGGIRVHMNTIGELFRSSSYGGNNSTYILSMDGSKLYMDERLYKDHVKGYNVFNVFRQLSEEQGLDFENVLETLKTSGLSLSSITIDGIECFYALKKMDNLDWIVMYIHPADQVASGTVTLVNSMLRMSGFSAAVLLFTIAVITFSVVQANRFHIQLREEQESSQQLQERNEQLEHEKKEVEDTYLAAQHANQAKTTFLNNMSHDIRTPMNAIIGFTSLALTHIDDKETIKNYLNKIMLSSEHLLSLINDVLDISRIESGKVKIEAKKCSLPSIIHDLRNIFQSDVKARRLNFYIDTVDVEHEDIICDKLRLNQVLINIMSNAMKFTRPGGTVSLRVVEKPSAPEGFADYQFIIKDTGVGMSEEFVRKIFEPFSREENSTISGIEGTGLGMAITKNIVDMMGGTVSVKSKLGEGSEFTVSLRFRISNHQKTITAIKSLEGFHALIADDNMDSCTSVEKMLRTIGMVPEWTTSGKEAIYRAKYALEENNPFKVYIIDFLMPDMNGMEVARRIRQEIGEQAIIIILSAYDWGDIDKEAKDAGVNAICAKPLFLSELYNILQNTNEIRSAKTVQEINPGDFKGKRVLLVDDVELNREIAVAILEEAGLEVESAENGKEAVEYVSGAKPGYIDLILMDVMMPVMDGYQAAREIRSLPDESLSHIPIIAMTANAFEEDRQAALDAGMNDHLAKPFQIGQLYKMMKQYLK